MQPQYVEAELSVSPLSHQGNLSLKDFDIRKEAGEVSFSAVEKVIQAQVFENFLEVHLFWAGKGTCCITKQGTHGPSISAISAVPNFVPTLSNTPRTLTSTRKTSTSLVVGIVVAVGVVCFLFVLVVYYILQRRKGLKSDEDEEFLGIASRPNTFSYAKLRIATEDFNPANKLGEGGFGPVYKEGVVHILIGQHAIISVWEQHAHSSCRNNWLSSTRDAMRGHLTEKADVFGFGIVALEIISGRLNSDTDVNGDKVYLLEWNWLILHYQNTMLWKPNDL
ncbi:hypothetical protein NE237_023368 [Protea cynaroides]|uniref:non-specific serine/threonine protein kinase n=1 Tax=Protea cynaroides TaxID=273540 RepID=A0A9Q0HH05_9MAGN|nr:hypothetical protein NE237_023368 [Protea cynaroides]